MDSQILDGMAKAYWADAWASQMEEMQLSGHLSGMEIMDVMPQELPAKAMEIAKKLYAKIEKDNNIKLEDFTPPGEEDFDKDLFGHYLAMEAMGHGVGWSDDHEDHGLEIPYVEESYELWDDAIAAIKAEYGDEAKEPEQEESVKARNRKIRESNGGGYKRDDKLDKFPTSLKHGNASHTFIQGEEDLGWLRDVHLPQLPKKYKFVVLYGNEDSPEGFEAYENENPECDDPMLVYVRDESGDDNEESVKANAKDLIESVMRGKNPKVVVEMGSSKAGTENAQLPKYLADKLAKMKQGEKVVMSDEDMSTLEALYDTDPDIKHLATMPNPKQHSTKDKWLAYFKK